MTATYPTAVVGYGQNDFTNVNELGSSTLVSQLNAGGTSSGVVSGTNVTTWPAGSFEIRIDNEVIFVTSRSGGSLFALVRGRGGTTDATHLAGATVRVVQSARHLVRLQEEIIALETALGVNLGNVSGVTGTTAQAYANRYILTGVTTNATPTEIFVGGVASTRVAIPTDTIAYAVLRVACCSVEAAEHGGSWSYDQNFVNDGGTVSLVGDATMLEGNKAVVSWDIVMGVNGANMTLTVTGDNSTNVRWTGYLVVVFCKKT